jgi:hypothetical protein
LLIYIYKHTKLQATYSPTQSMKLIIPMLNNLQKLVNIIVENILT